MFLTVLVLLLVFIFLSLLVHHVVCSAWLFWKINDRAYKAGIIPTEVDWGHVINYWPQKVNYYFRASLFPLYWLKVKLNPKTPDSYRRAALRMLVEGSLCTFTDIVRDTDDEVGFLLKFKDFKCSLRPHNPKRVTLEIAYTLYTSQSLEEGRIDSVVYDGMSVVSPREQLTLLALAASVYSHPYIHGYFNELYKCRTVLLQHDKKLEDLFLYGTYLNEIANTVPGWAVSSPDCFRTLLFDLSEREFPRHRTTAMLKLSRWSSVLRFALQSRRELFRIVRQFSLHEINPELLFISGVLHSLDHHSYWKCVNGYDLGFETLPANNSYMNFHAFLLMAPSQDVFAPTVKSLQDKHPFYRAWYTMMRNIDQEWADRIAPGVYY